MRRRFNEAGVALTAGLSLILCTGQASGQQLPDDGDERKISPWAAAGLLRDPVAFTMDWAGNVYIAESDRAGEAVTDTRNLQHLNGVEEDLLLRTVEDRRALIQKWLDAGAFDADYFTRTEDRVRLVRDTDGDGVADSSTVFAGGFNDVVDGIGAGVLWRDGAVYYTCIPNLWLLRDEDGDGEAEVRESLSYGYGVRWCFYGHDLHGLTNGPDGRIYFSMGDRGFNVTSKEGVNYFGPDRGAVFRCWPDGSGLELFHLGLRNPQELAFDEFGNLFTGDNNCDSGDRARVVYCMEGGDSGWRQNVQSLPSRGPWNREHIWELLTDPRDPSRPAWTLPPIDHVGAGPSGLAYYPGTGESHAYDDTFFMVDFYGAGSTIHSFRAAPDGAGFRLTEKHEYYKGTTVTDIAWGPDSRLYVSDWGEGWGPNDKGNMFTIVNETVHADPRAAAAIKDVRGLLGEGFAQRGEDELIALLGHADQRIRLAAQYELASRGGGVAPSLASVADDASAGLMQRIHAIWCLGQIARDLPDAAGPLEPLLTDRNEQVRLATVRTLGDLRLGPTTVYEAALADSSLQVRAAAAIALGKAGSTASLPKLLDALEVNDDEDVYLRNGLVHGLALMNDPEVLLIEAEGRGRAARMGTVLALRRLENIGVAAYLADPDPGVAIEAARAVYDLHMDAGMPALAEKLEGTIDPAMAIEPFLRRAIEANVLLGSPEHAARLAGFAANSDVAPEWRMLALERLRDWDQPLKREGVWGDWVDLPGRPTDDARRGVLANLDAVRAAAAGDAQLLVLADALDAKYSLEFNPETATAALVDPARDESYRLVLLDQFEARAPERLTEACQAVLAAPAAATTPALRIEARSMLLGRDEAAGIAALDDAIEHGEVAEQQHAVRTLGTLDAQAAKERVTALYGQLAGSTVEPAIALEVFESAAAASTSKARAAVDAVTAAQPKRPAGFETALLRDGGDAARGHEIFLHHEAAQCQRCHSIGPGGPTVGPDLAHVGSRSPRTTLVQSVVEPNAVVAEGFGTVSAMPEMSVLLQPADVRDVVAFLATLVDPAMGPAPEPEPGSVAAASGGHAEPGATGQGAGTSPWWWVLLPVGMYGVVLLPLIVWLATRLRRP